MSESMLALQITIMSMATNAKGWFDERYDIRDDRGEITSQTVLIFILASAAVLGGGYLYTKITDNAANVPDPVTP